MSDLCGYAITDDDGEMQPCDRPVTGWRWYQDAGEHEDMLDVACDWHENEGGRLIHTLKAERDRARNIAVALEQRLARVSDVVEQLAHSSSLTDCTRRDSVYADARDDERVDNVEALRAALEADR